MKNLFLICLLFLTSCASYVDGLHRQISAAEKAQQMRRYSNAGNANNFKGDKRPILNPVTLQGSVPNTSNFSNLPPQTERDYEGSNRRRYTANDFRDNDPTGSLWKEKNSDSFLFISNTNKKEGDIVIIEVMSKLKIEITNELKRAFPPPPKKSKEPEKDEEEENPVDENDQSKIYDKISTQVMENVNKEYLLIKGRKEVIFRKTKRYIEVSAIVSSKDIRDDNTISSVKLLEPKVSILRY